MDWRASISAGQVKEKEEASATISIYATGRPIQQTEHQAAARVPRRSRAPRSQQRSLTRSSKGSAPSQKEPCTLDATQQSTRYLGRPNKQTAARACSRSLASSFPRAVQIAKHRRAAQKAKQAKLSYGGLGASPSRITLILDRTEPAQADHGAAAGLLFRELVLLALSAGVGIQPRAVGIQPAHPASNFKHRRVAQKAKQEPAKLRRARRGASPSRNGIDSGQNRTGASRSWSCRRAALQRARPTRIQQAGRVTG